MNDHLKKAREEMNRFFDSLEKMSTEIQPEKTELQKASEVWARIWDSIDRINTETGNKYKVNYIIGGHTAFAYFPHGKVVSASGDLIFKPLIQEAGISASEVKNMVKTLLSIHNGIEVNQVI